MIKSIIDFIRKGKLEDTNSRAITFSNLVFISVPLVYLIFLLIDLNTYLRPIEDLKWDQFIVPIFIFLSPLFFYLNNNGFSKIARITFLAIWPFALHIIPIALLNTPTDYYLAFPFGIVFHAVLIQFMVSRKDESIIFYSLLTINFITLIYFPQILERFALDQSLQILSASKYYFLDAILYWLLFNIIISYIFEVVSHNIYRLKKDKELIEFKNQKIQDTYDQLSTTKNQLVQSEKMASLGVLVGGFAHEINNPLNIIAGNIDLLNKLIQSDDNLDKEEIEALVENATAGSERLKQVIKNMRILSVGDEKTVSVSVKDIIENALKLSQITTVNNISIDKKLEEKEIECYPAKLHKIIISVLENAKFELEKINQPPYLHLKLDFFDTGMEIKISNNGQKIPESALSKIFDPFFSMKDPGEGLGLGLYITYQIVQELGGTITINQPGDLVSFVVNIPYQLNSDLDK